MKTFVINGGDQNAIDKFTNALKVGAIKAYEESLKAMTLSQIAREIRKDWKKVYFGAVPYLDAMSTLNSINDNYFADSGRSVVLYFLSNATTWKGETAKAVKKELNKRAK